MSRYAVINESDNIVSNVVEWDGNEETWQPPEGTFTWPDDGQQANIGYLYDPAAHTFTPPAEPAPEPPAEEPPAEQEPPADEPY